MKFGKTETTPGRPQDTEPCNAILGIGQSFGECHRIEDFGTVLEIFELDSAERDVGIAQCCRDGGEGGARATEHRNAIAFAAVLRSVNTLKVSSNESDDLGDLLSAD